MKRFIAFLLCAAILSFSLMLTGCSCMGCGTDTGMNAADDGTSSGTANNGMTNSGGVTGGMDNSGTQPTGDLTDDLKNGVDDLIDGAEGMLNNVKNTIDGTPDGADTYGADDKTNLDDMGKRK